MLQTKDPGKGTSSSRKQRQVENKIFFRLPPSSIPFFQSMAEDYYQRGKIKAPTIGLLAKKCLMTAGDAWNRMTLQLMTQDFERRRQKVEQERQWQQQLQNYEQRREFGQSSGDLMP